MTFSFSFQVLTLSFFTMLSPQWCGHFYSIQKKKKKPNSSKDKVWPLGYFTWHPKGCLSDHSLHKGTHLQSPLLLSAHPSPPTALTSRTFRNWPALCRHPDRKELHQEASYSVLSSLVPMCFPLSPSMLILGLKRTHHL